MDTSSINAQSIFDDNAAMLKLSWLTGMKAGNAVFPPTRLRTRRRAPISSAT